MIDIIKIIENLNLNRVHDHGDTSFLMLSNRVAATTTTTKLGSLNMKISV